MTTPMKIRAWEDWSESFWQIKLYTAEDLHDRPRAQASLIFAATMTGDLVFLSDRRNQRTPHQSIDHLPWNNSKHFCANGEVFYTPWSPGDIIKIDGRPFDHGPRFAIVLEDDKDPSVVIEERGMKQVSDTGAIEAKSTALRKAISA